MSEIDRLQHLVTDLMLLGNGHLSVSDNWVRTSRSAPCLAGAVSDHPLLPGNGRLLMTSDVFVIAKDAGSARTLSRWYRPGVHMVANNPLDQIASEGSPMTVNGENPFRSLRGIWFSRRSRAVVRASRLSALISAARLTCFPLHRASSLSKNFSKRCLYLTSLILSCRDTARDFSAWLHRRKEGQEPSARAP